MTWLDNISLGWWCLLLGLIATGVFWLMWLDRPKEDPSSPEYLNGCGRQCSIWESHLCRCARSRCDNNYHVCRCGAGWFSPREKEVG